jgi:thymidylate synthase
MKEHNIENQIDGVKEQLNREPYPLQTLDIHPGMLDYELDKLEIDMFKILNYQSQPAIKIPLSN